MFAVYFPKKWIYWRHGVDVGDEVTTTKAIRRVNGKDVFVFCYFYVNKWLITKQFAKKKKLFDYCN